MAGRGDLKASQDKDAGCSLVQAQAMRPNRPFELPRFAARSWQLNGSVGPWDDTAVTEGFET